MKIVFPLLLFLCLIAACSSRVEHARVPQRPASDNAININKASVAELEALPYIGRTTAEAIVAYREANGPFRRPEHIMLIRGVSEKRFLEIQRLITAN